MSQKPDRTDVPSNTELAERITRVEEGVEHVDTKLDHHGDTLDRIEQGLADDLEEKADRLDDVEPKVNRLWHAKEQTKWIIMYLSGGGVLALFVSLALGGI